GDGGVGVMGLAGSVASLETIWVLACRWSGVRTAAGSWADGRRRVTVADGWIWVGRRRRRWTAAAGVRWMGSLLAREDAGWRLRICFWRRDRARQRGRMVGIMDLDGQTAGSGGRVRSPTGRGWWDRIQRVVLDILGGLDQLTGRPAGARRRQPWLSALLRVMEHHTGAPVVHRKSLG
ncbi:hypothetical protein ACLOJK_031750, partial [Asimina triloba]